MTKPIPRTLESSLWPIVKRVIPHAQRLESGMTALGIPDVFYSHFKHHGFIELKVARWQKKGQLVIKWRAGQIAWLSTHDLEGGHVWVFVITEGNVLWLIQGIAASHFAKAFHPDLLQTHATYCGTKSAPDYDKLERYL